MPVYDDLLDELEYGKRCAEQLLVQDVPAAEQAVAGQCSFNVEWYSEPMPLETREGDALEREVRQLIAQSCDKEAPPDPPRRQPLPPQEDVLVFADQGGFCERMLGRAPEGRVGFKKVVTTPPSAIDADEIDSLLATQTWDLLLVGCTLDPPQSNAVADIIDRQSEVVRFLLLLLKACYRREGCCRRIAVLAHDVFSEEEDTHKERGLGIVAHATLFGLLNTARLELDLPIQLVDVELLTFKDLLPHVAAEVFRLSTFGVNTVRHCYPYLLKRGIKTNKPAGRYVLRQVTTHNYEKAGVKFSVPEQGVVAISGGNGALALVMGKWLLDTAERQKEESGGAYRPSFAIHFLSRSTKVSDLNLPNWQRVQQRAAELGVEVEQARMDVSSQTEVDEYIARVSPNLVGLIHAAGVLQDGMLPNQTWERFQAVYASKHWAALYLHDALERYSNPNLSFFWMFSSTSVYGNMGQINYASSNSCLDALARHRAALGKPACAIQWGAWGEVGMAATMDDAIRRRMMAGPMPFFTVKQGLEGLEEGLRTGLPGFSVFVLNPQVYFGMVMADGNTTARYTRNFTSEYIPTPPPPAFDKEQTYNIYRMYRYLLHPYGDTAPIVWSKHIEPRLRAQQAKAEEEEELPMAALSMQMCVVHRPAAAVR